LEKATMLYKKNHFASLALLGAVVLGSSVPAKAQNSPVNPATRPQAPNQTSAFSGVAAPLGAGYVPPAAYPPAYPGYPPYQVLGPAGSYLSGASDVISSQGQFLVSKRQSEVIKEQAEQAKLDTKRKAIEEWQYEQAIAPKLSEVQAKAQQEGYMQALGNPSEARIWSGEALNTLLRTVQQPGAAGGRAPSIPIDPDMVSKLNFTDGTNRGNLLFFSKGPKLEWPFVLRDPRFKDERDRVEALTAAAIRQAGAGEIDFGTVKDLQNTTNKMLDDLKDRIDDVTPSDYVKSKRFLNDLYKASHALGDAGAAKALAKKDLPPVGTVDQLVAMLTSQGLRFAPASTGNEAAYTSLYQSLRAFSVGSSHMVAQSPPGPRQRQ
jgi:hypothetical protein